jgi:hypothetical protein
MADGVQRRPSDTGSNPVGCATSVEPCEHPAEHRPGYCLLNYSINSLAASLTAPNLDTATPSRQAVSQAGEQRNTEGQAAQGKPA